VQSPQSLPASQVAEGPSVGRHLRALEPNLGGGAGSPPEVAVASERPRTEKLGRDLSIHTQRRKWQSRADTWDRHNDVGMSKVASMAVEAAKVRPGADCVDLGCGGGRLALALAREGANVLGVDVSESMIRRMEAQAAEEGLHSVRGMVAPIEHLELPAASLDLVVTNYALHHLLDGEKEKVVRAAAQWLRPGGRLVVADLMLGRGAAARDREIIASKVRVMARKGLPGYWRIAKNAFRFLLRVHERPITPEAWVALFEAAGFTEVESVPVVAEAAIVSGVKPLGG